MRAEDVRAAAGDLSVFARLVGWPLTATQAGALGLATRTTVVLAPRQTGKSYSLAVLAVWAAFRAPDQRVLIVSAGDEASKRLLSTVRRVTAHPLLAGSVLDESSSLVVLSNGSEVRSVPASERQIRGWSVDLLIVDEAALVSDEVLLGAAFPTTTARPDARIVLASTPWAADGAFYRLHLDGLDQRSAHTRTHRWTVGDAPWITPSVIEHARATLPPLRFAAEYEGEFVGAADSYFPAADLRAAVAGYLLVPPAEAEGGSVVVGLDWGRAYDRHAVATVGVLDDHGVNQETVYYLPWIETSTRPYGEQVAVVAGMARRRRRVTVPYGTDPQLERVGPYRLHGSGWTLPNPAARVSHGYDLATVVTEMNGVGAMPSEELARRLRRVKVVGVYSSQRSKEDAYGRIGALLAERRLVLPDDPDLLRQLHGLRCVPTPSGGLTIEASSQAVHDDLADALSLAVSALPPGRPSGRWTNEPDDVEWVATPGGVQVPRRPRPTTSTLRPSHRNTSR